jgi:hypothetical protein
LNVTLVEEDQVVVELESEGRDVLLGRRWSDGVWQFKRILQTPSCEEVSNWVEGWDQALEARPRLELDCAPKAVHPEFIEPVRLALEEQLRGKETVYALFEDRGCCLPEMREARERMQVIRAEWEAMLRRAGGHAKGG